LFQGLQPDEQLPGICMKNDYILLRGKLEDRNPEKDALGTNDFPHRLIAIM
jgi:hypothetical protein